MTFTHLCVISGYVRTFRCKNLAGNWNSCLSLHTATAIWWKL